MDPEIIATSAATLLATKAWEAYATQAGTAAWTRMTQLATRLRQRLGITPTDEPQTETIQRVATQLREIAATEDELSQAVTDFLTLAQQNYHGVGIAIGNNSYVGKAVYIQNVQHDVNF